MAKQARQICSEKLRLVHTLSYSGVFFREIGHLATIPIFGQISGKKVQIIKHEWTPDIYKIKLYWIVIILYRMHTRTQKKHNPPKTAAIRLTLLLFPLCTKPRARYQNSEPPNQRNRSRLASRSNCIHLKEISLPISHILFLYQYHIYIDNTFRACDKDSPDKKPRARLIYITIRVNRI